MMNRMKYHFSYTVLLLYRNYVVQYLEIKLVDLLEVLLIGTPVQNTEHRS